MTDIVSYWIVTDCFEYTSRKFFITTISATKGMGRTTMRYVVTRPLRPGDRVMVRQRYGYPLDILVKREDVEGGSVWVKA
jgi:hypothetical protein